MKNTVKLNYVNGTKESVDIQKIKCLFVSRKNKGVFVSVDGDKRFYNLKNKYKSLKNSLPFGGFAHPKTKGLTEFKGLVINKSLVSEVRYLGSLSQKHYTTVIDFKDGDSMVLDHSSIKFEESLKTWMRKPTLYIAVGKKGVGKSRFVTPNPVSYIENIGKTMNLKEDDFKTMTLLKEDDFKKIDFGSIQGFKYNTTHTHDFVEKKYTDYKDLVVFSKGLKDFCLYIKDTNKSIVAQIEDAFLEYTEATEHGDIFIKCTLKPESNEAIVLRKIVTIDGLVKTTSNMWFDLTIQPISNNKEYYYGKKEQQEEK